MAATANGTLTPPSATEPTLNTASVTSDTSGNKRKREDEPRGHLAAVDGSEKQAQTQRDVLAILQQYDTSPSFLEHAFEDEPPNGTSGPSQKKARLADGLSTNTISAKLSSGAYPTLLSLKDDAALVTKALETSLRGQGQENESQSANRLSVDDLKRIQRAKAFQGLVDEIVDKENRSDGTVKQEKSSAKSGPIADAKATDRLGAVLTLFGNAPTPKQLFSSMQNTSSAAKQEPSIKSELPVEEMSLPNGLAATRIMPMPADHSRKAPTFEEAFAPPYNLAAIQPPKAHKRLSTRDTTITWEFKDSLNRSSKKGGYTVQSQVTGDWLGYGGVDLVHGVSMKEKRKQRERALSSGAESVKETQSKATPEELQAAEEEALFRRAYGSFAPCIDNAKSVTPAETKSMIWWHKVGEKRFNETFALDPALLDEPLMPAPEMFPDIEDIAIEDEEFERVVNEMTDVDESIADAPPSMSKTDVRHVLRQVSELLETLASYQRIRNSTLPSSTAVSRTPISPAPLLSSRIGKPDEPAEDEISTYNALRRELAYLILKLPPYAVAKIDGDQLAELGVRTLIPFQSKDVKGTMEEDAVARLAKYNAQATAAGVATLTRGGSSSGQHYSTTAQRTPAIGQAANTRYAQTPQYKTTPAAVPQYQRSTSSQAQYNTPSATTVPRPSYTQPTAQYTRPGATQQQSSYSQQYYQQRPQPPPPAASYGTYNSQYSQSQTPQQQRPTYSTSQPLAQYQQRSHAAAANAVAYQTNSGSQAQQQAGLTAYAQQLQQPQRTASPAKPVAYGGAPVYGQTPQQQQAMSVQPKPVGYPAQPQQQQYVPQHALPTSGRATPVGASQPPQTPVGAGYPQQQRP